MGPTQDSDISSMKLSTIVGSLSASQAWKVLSAAAITLVAVFGLGYKFSSHLAAARDAEQMAAITAVQGQNDVLKLQAYDHVRDLLAAREDVLQRATEVYRTEAAESKERLATVDSFLSSANMSSLDETSLRLRRYLVMDREVGLSAADLIALARAQATLVAINRIVRGAANGAGTNDPQPGPNGRRVP